MKRVPRIDRGMGACPLSVRSDRVAWGLGERGRDCDTVTTRDSLYSCREAAAIEIEQYTENA